MLSTLTFLSDLPRSTLNLGKRNARGMLRQLWPGLEFGWPPWLKSTCRSSNVAAHAAIDSVEKFSTCLDFGEEIGHKLYLNGLIYAQHLNTELFTFSRQCEFSVGWRKLLMRPYWPLENSTFPQGVCSLGCRPAIRSWTGFLIYILIASSETPLDADGDASCSSDGLKSCQDLVDQVSDRGQVHVDGDADGGGQAVNIGQELVEEGGDSVELAGEVDADISRDIDGGENRGDNVEKLLELSSDIVEGALDIRDSAVKEALDGGLEIGHSALDGREEVVDDRQDTASGLQDRGNKAVDEGADATRASVEAEVCTLSSRSWNSVSLASTQADRLTSRGSNGSGGQGSNDP
jgi:hypothetical protein